MIKKFNCYRFSMLLFILFFLLGSGLFANKNFEAQEFIGIYTGEIIDSHEGFKRLEHQRTNNSMKQSYLYFVDNVW